MSYKLLFWSDRDVSLSAVVLLAACAFAVTTLLLGASATLDIEARDISPQAVILAVKQALKTTVLNIMRTLTASIPWYGMKRKLKDLDMPMQRFCECETENRNIAYCTGGCLQCPVKDCAYYIVNFSNSVIEMYT